jgi:Kef-type K+ transport system membrane component KefB
MTDQEVQLFLAAWPSSPLARLLGMAARRLGRPPVLGEIIPSIVLPPTASATLTFRAAPGAASVDLDQWIQD